MLDGWTVPQILAGIEIAKRHQAAQAAERLQELYLAMGAAQGGKKGYRALRLTLKRLYREAGMAEKEDATATPLGLAQAMGLQVR